MDFKEKRIKNKEKIIDLCKNIQIQNKRMKYNKSFFTLLYRPQFPNFIIIDAKSDYH